MSLLVAIGSDRASLAADPHEPKRMVLVKLWTSQGCEMCPRAEEVLL